MADTILRHGDRVVSTATDELHGFTNGQEGNVVRVDCSHLNESDPYTLVEVRLDGWADSTNFFPSEVQKM